jgi:hypothetical protein
MTIHRPAAVIDRAQVAEVRGADLGRMDESGQHRRGGEHGDLPVPLQRIENGGHVEMRQHYLGRPIQQVRQRIEPGSVRHGRGQEMGVTLV